MERLWAWENIESFLREREPFLQKRFPDITALKASWYQALLGSIA
jgi:hypothetical protein